MRITEKFEYQNLQGLLFMTAQQALDEILNDPELTDIEVENFVESFNKYAQLLNSTLNEICVIMIEENYYNPEKYFKAESKKISFVANLYNYNKMSLIITDKSASPFDLYYYFFKNIIEANAYIRMIEEIPLNSITETYSKDELQALKGKVYNQQKIENIYRRKKYNDNKLYAHTICTKCGRHKNIFLSNLIKNPDKYGSCICSDKNIDGKVDHITKLYDGSKKLKNNTSGYTGVSFVKNYKGLPYNKWRAYIDLDGKRSYLGDFDIKLDAIKARKAAADKGLKWYKENKNKIIQDLRNKKNR